jgi:hypothetical protein
MSDSSESGEEVQVDHLEAEVTVVAQEEEEEVAHGTLVEMLEHLNPGATLQGMALDVVIGRDLPPDSHIVSEDQNRLTQFKMRRLHATIVRQRVELTAANDRIEQQKQKLRQQKQQLRQQKDYYKKQMKILRRQIDHPDHNITKSRLRK